MISNTILMDLVSSQAASTVKNKKVSSEGIADYPKFKSFLDDNASRKSVREDSTGTLEKSVKAYSQISRNNKLKVKQQDEVSSNEIKADGKDRNLQEDKDASSVKEKVVIKGIADLLGITPEELKAMLDSLGNKPSELTDPLSSSMIIAKLSDLIGLDENQQRYLTTAVNEINSFVDNYLGQSEGTQWNDKQNWVKIEGVDVEVVNTAAPDLREVAEILEAKLHELVHTLQNNKDVSLESIASKIKQMITDTNIQKQILEKKDAMKNEEMGEVAEEDSSENSSDTVNAAIQPVDSTDTYLDSTINQNEEMVMPVTGTGEPHKETAAFKSREISSEVRVVKNELMSQVVEKAKVLLDGQKSEMVMELKPESLGKLALKVVTENGIVMAKFVAENQQVKEVLESNMQLLKDSLEKQGMTIQGFSVSVGQDSERGFNMQQEFHNTRRNSSGKTHGEGNMVAASSFEESQIINPYAVSESSVDFKA